MREGERRREKATEGVGDLARWRTCKVDDSAAKGIPILHREEARSAPRPVRDHRVCSHERVERWSVRGVARRGVGVRSVRGIQMKIVMVVE